MTLRRDIENSFTGVGMENFVEKEPEEQRQKIKEILIESGEEVVGRQKKLAKRKH